MCFLDSAKDKMSVIDDFDLNSWQRYCDSLEVLRHTMLNQEVLFRKQVYELHRLYHVQRSLMKDFDGGEFNGGVSWKSSSQLPPSPFMNPIIYEPEAKKTRSGSIPMVDSVTLIGKELFEGRHDNCYKLLQRPLDLQLPADQYINFFDDNRPAKESVLDDLKSTKAVKHSPYGDNISDPVDLKLSLSFGLRENNRRDVIMKNNQFDRKTLSYSKVIIDLEEEESTEISNGDPRDMASLEFDSLINNFGVKHLSQASVQSNPFISRRVEMGSDHETAGNSSLVDLTEHCREWNSSNQEDDVLFKNLSPKKRKSTPLEAVDLNTVQPDDSSCYSNNPMVADPSLTSSSGCIEQADSVPEGSCSITIFRKEISKKSEAEDNVSLCSDQIKLTNPNKYGDKSPASCKSAFGSENGGKNHSLSSENKESAQLDALIRNAAESLIHISTACNQDNTTKEEQEMEEREQLQCSLDSFELITLQLRVMSPEENEVSSKPFEVNDTEKKEFGVKLRRGRRMKDFQKDILPGMASLSRHEIHEDMSILEAVLRSREYRKMRAKMGCAAGSWLPPMRSKRPRLKCVGKRKFS